jgi:hypothetical protein
MARQGDCPSAPLRARGLRSLGRSGNPLTEEEGGSGACSAKKGSESAISPSRFAVQGAPLVFQMRGTQRRLVEEVELPAVGKYTYRRVRWGDVSFRNTSISKSCITATSATSGQEFILRRWAL